MNGFDEMFFNRWYLECEIQYLVFSIIFVKHTMHFVDFSPCLTIYVERRENDYQNTRENIQKPMRLQFQHQDIWLNFCIISERVWEREANIGIEHMLLPETKRIATTRNPVWLLPIFRLFLLSSRHEMHWWD